MSAWLTPLLRLCAIRTGSRGEVKFKLARSIIRKSREEIVGAKRADASAFSYQVPAIRHSLGARAQVSYLLRLHRYDRSSQT